MRNYLGSGRAKSVLLVRQKENLISDIKFGASWFFVIAFASIISTIFIIAGIPIRLPFNFGVIQLANVVAPIINKTHPIILVSMVYGAGVVVSILISTGTIIFGVLSRHMFKWIYFIGMVLYFFDGLLYGVSSFFNFEPFGILFHIYILYKLYEGFSAIGALKRLQADTDNVVIENGMLTNEHPNLDEMSETTEIKKGAIFTSAGAYVDFS